MPANPTSSTSGYELKDDLARLCLASARREPERKLAWVNSVCLMFLFIGIFGARQGAIAIEKVPPIREIIPIVIQPPTAAPQQVAPKPEQPAPSSQPQVLVALPDAPDVNFGIPTAGSLVVPAALASAPQIAPVRIGALSNTGAGGDRPEPPYPPIALQTGEQGTVVLTLTGDDAGKLVSAEIKQSSGFPVLDHATVDYVRRHWRLPVNSGTRRFQTSITYQLQLN